MEIKAHLNELRLSPRKVRIVARSLKGMRVDRAEQELRIRPKRATGPLLKLLHSATANAMHNFQISSSDLSIKKIFVNGGTVLKRLMPRAFGRGATIRKRTSHITMVLDSEKAAVVARRTMRGMPVLRDVESGDSADLLEKKAKEKRISLEHGSVKSRRRGFARKIFQRKAI